MVPYNELNSIEQAILNWRNGNPVIVFVALFVCIAITVVSFVIERRYNIEKQQQQINRQRAQRRAWIKQNGGL